MEHVRILGIYSYGPDLDETSSITKPKRKRKRASKLQPFSHVINEFRASGKSFEWIARMLVAKHSINCNRSSIYRFVKKLRSL